LKNNLWYLSRLSFEFVLFPLGYDHLGSLLDSTQNSFASPPCFHGLGAQPALGSGADVH